MKILVTAFEPFGSNALNSSQEVAALLPDAIGECVVVRELLPVDFRTAGNQLRSLIERHTPDVVLMLGQSRKFAGLSIERVALNLMDATNPDNSGYIPVNEVIHSDGATAHLTTFPVRELSEACHQKGIAAQISNSAGTYVCNRVYYEALYTIAKNRLPIQALFVHLPFIPEQGKMPSIAKEDLTEGIVTIMTKTLSLPWHTIDNLNASNT